jgi:hypothetical protein
MSDERVAGFRVGLSPITDHRSPIDDASDTHGV